MIGSRKKPVPSPQDIGHFTNAAKAGDDGFGARFLKKFGTRHIDTRNTHGDTALTLAARFNQVVVVRRLLEAGAGVDVRDGHRGTALMAASVGGHIDVLQELLDHGADITKKSYAHKTAHWYADVNHHSAAATLIADTPRRHAEKADRTAQSLTGGIEKPIVVIKPLRFAARP